MKETKKYCRNEWGLPASEGRLPASDGQSAAGVWTATRTAAPRRAPPHRHARCHAPPGRETQDGAKGVPLASQRRALTSRGSITNALDGESSSNST